jgi:hypothetical protein
MPIYISISGVPVVAADVSEVVVFVSFSSVVVVSEVVVASDVEDVVSVSLFSVVVEEAVVSVDSEVDSVAFVPVVVADPVVVSPVVFPVVAEEAAEAYNLLCLSAIDLATVSSGI